MGKLVWKFEKPFFQDIIPEKMVKQNFPKVTRDYRSKQILSCKKLFTFRIGNLGPLLVI
jgi:hypothetical protein